MSVSIEMLIVELGVSVQPFQESFKKYKDWVTWSWMVSVWKKCDMFKVVIDKRITDWAFQFQTALWWR